MWGEPLQNVVDRVIGWVAALFGRSPKPVPAYVVVRTRQEPDPQQFRDNLH
jgi:hypothetical protein